MKNNLFSRLLHSKIHSRGMYKINFRKTLSGRKKNYPRKSIFATKGRLIKTEVAPPIKGKVEFWHLKIIKELFPKNVPNVHSVEILKEGGKEIGYALHMKEEKLNPELRNYMEYVIENGHHNKLNKHYNSHFDLVFDNLRVEAINGQMAEWGIETKFNYEGMGIGKRGNASNVSVANPHQPVFFEPKIYKKETFMKKLRKSKIPKEKKERIMKYYTRLLEAEEKLKAAKGSS